MRDAVGLLDKVILIDGITHIIVGFYIIPDMWDLYVKLQKPDGLTINYLYSTLQPYLSQQIRL